jgi:FkbM family methyltransferase
MVKIEQLQPKSAPRLGEECRFAVVGEPVSGVEFFLEHQGILYPSCLASKDSDCSVRTYLEVPGRYRLHATWRSAVGEQGSARIEFVVGGSYASSPRLVNVGDNTSLWTPSSWDAQLLGVHEAATFRALAKIIQPGATVYDIGANVGLFSVRFARAIGPAGQLYALEPNPVCVYFLRANLEHAQVSNFSILPLAASRSRSQSSFALNYGSTMLGVGHDSPYAGKHGHRIQVSGESLDILIDELSLRPPNFIKIDVEGAEASTIEGMMGTIDRQRPTIMIELHGRTAASDTLKQLARFDYQYSVPLTGTEFGSAADLIAWFPDACVQVIGVSQDPS